MFQFSYYFQSNRTKYLELDALFNWRLLSVGTCLSFKIQLSGNEDDLFAMNIMDSLLDTISTWCIMVSMCKSDEFAAIYRENMAVNVKSPHFLKWFRTNPTSQVISYDQPG